MLKKFFVILFIILISLYTTVVYAVSTPVTDENLQEALKRFEDSNSNDENYTISVANNTITITTADVDYVLNYDLTNNPTFSYEINIQQGMSYEEFESITSKNLLPMFGYIAVANIQGVDFKDATTYFSMSYIKNAFSNLGSNKNQYLIVDDTDGATNIESSNYEIIYTSEFGEKVMEYTNSIYGEPLTINDSADGMNTYEITIEQKDVTETSCKIVSTLTVNLDADFSKLINYTAQIGENFLNEDITEDNADYVIKLKEGQKCIIESSEEVTSYSMSGADCIDFNSDRTEIIATRAGKENGYLYIGEDNIEKTIYVIVEENELNQELDPITIRINTGNNTPNTDTPNVNIANDNLQTEEEEDPTVSRDPLPQTGLSEMALVIIVCCFFAGLVVIFGIKNNKYKDVK